MCRSVPPSFAGRSGCWSGVDLLLRVMEFERHHDLADAAEDRHEADPEQDQCARARRRTAGRPTSPTGSPGCPRTDPATTAGWSRVTGPRRSRASNPPAPAGTPAPTPTRRTCRPVRRIPTAAPRMNSTPSAMCTNFHPPGHGGGRQELVDGRPQEHEAQEDAYRCDRGDVEAQHQHADQQPCDAGDQEQPPVLREPGGLPPDLRIHPYPSLEVCRGNLPSPRRRFPLPRKTPARRGERARPCVPGGRSASSRASRGARGWDSRR